MSFMTDDLPAPIAGALPGATTLEAV